MGGQVNGMVRRFYPSARSDYKLRTEEECNGAFYVRCHVLGEAGGIFRRVILYVDAPCFRCYRCLFSDCEIVA